MTLTPRLSTARKMALARWLRRCVVGIRRLGGRTDTEVVCRRRGVRWSLDLNEGIQFAIYVGLYEPTTYKRLTAFASRGGVAIDIGANIGAHTLPLARAIGASGRVIAIEPTATSFARLVRNCELNSELVARITPIQAALGAPGGQLKPAYYSRWPLEPGQSDHAILKGAAESTSDAGFFTLDELVGTLARGPVTLIKIDVDGGELDVLGGAVGTIERDHPVVVFELCPYLLVEHGRSGHELLAFFASRGYRVVDERTLDPVGTDTSRIIAAIPDGGSRNLVALPAVDRRDRFQQGAPAR